MFSLKKKNQENISAHLLTVDKAKFRKPVCPGDTLYNKVEKNKTLKTYGNLNVLHSLMTNLLLKLKYQLL